MRQSYELHGEEVRSAPLHVDALQGFGVVTGPEFFEVRQDAVVGAAASAGAGLDHQCGILGADAFHNVAQATVVVNVEVRLLVGGEVGGAVVGYGHVGVPFDVGYLRILCHQVVYYAEYEILNCGVRCVQYQLGASASGTWGAVRLADNPVGMFLVQFTAAVGHFRFYPDPHLKYINWEQSY